MADPITELAHELGIPLPPLRPFEKVVKVTVVDAVAVLMVETYRVVETYREIKFADHGTRLTVFTRSPESGDWSQTSTMIHWDDDFTPVIHLKYGKVVTPAEAAERDSWDRLCYRPGTKRTPLDSYSRVMAGPSTKKMDQYW